MDIAAKNSNIKQPKDKKKNELELLRKQTCCRLHVDYIWSLPRTRKTHV